MNIIPLDKVEYRKAGERVVIFRPVPKDLGNGKAEAGFTTVEGTVITPVIEVWQGERELKHYVVEVNGEQLELTDHNVYSPDDIEGRTPCKCHRCAGWGSNIHGRLQLEAIGLDIPAGETECSWCRGSGWGLEDRNFRGYPPYIKEDDCEDARSFLNYLINHTDSKYRDIDS